MHVLAIIGECALYLGGSVVIGLIIGSLVGGR